MIAVYRLAPIGVDGALEAEGVEHWTCSIQHAQQLGATMTTPFAIEDSSDAVAGTVCEVCGVTEDAMFFPQQQGHRAIRTARYGDA